MLDKIKAALDITSTARDTDINDAIAAAEADMERVGITVISETDALTVQAVKLYCRAEFNYEGDSERYRASYEKLRDSMSLCGDYNAE